MDGSSSGITFVSSEKLSQAEVVLNKRYAECNSYGHKKQDVGSNYCNYCYRHLNYKSSKVDAILDSRKNLPLDQVPLDAPILNDIANEEINHNRHMDKLKGLRKIIEELKL